MRRRRYSLPLARTDGPRRLRVPNHPGSIALVSRRLSIIDSVSGHPKRMKCLPVRTVRAAMTSRMTRFALAITTAMLALGCGDNGSVWIEIERFEATLTTLSSGEKTTLHWRIDTHAHIELLHWVTLFPGKVDESSVDGPDGLAVVWQKEGTYRCTYTTAEELVCVDELEPLGDRIVIAISKGEARQQHLTIRACVTGIDEDGGSDDAHTSCEYASITLTLEPPG